MTDLVFFAYLAFAISSKLSGQSEVFVDGDAVSVIEDT